MAFAAVSFIALLLLMLVSGVFWGPWFALHRSLHTFNGDTFIKIVRAIAGNLALPMRLLMPACLLFMLLSAVYYPHKGSLFFYSNAAAFGLSVLSLIITLGVEVPIVTRVLGWTEDTIPADWEALRNRWVRFHVLRTFTSLAAFVLFSASLIGLLQ